MQLFPPREAENGGRVPPRRAGGAAINRLYWGALAGSLLGLGLVAASVWAGDVCLAVGCALLQFGALCYAVARVLSDHEYRIGRLEERLREKAGP